MERTMVAEGFLMSLFLFVGGKKKRGRKMVAAQERENG
jgi:hypothetical protein